ncbi:hypothetical protein ACQRBF_02925 [Peptoniphilaceae bacterium SGI.131]
MNYRPFELEKRKIAEDKKIKNLKYKAIAFYLCVVILVALLSPVNWRENFKNFSIFLGLVPVAICLVAALVFTFNDMRLHIKFNNSLNELVAEYRKKNDANKFYDSLMNFQAKPRSFKQELVYYINVSTALFDMGRTEESLELLERIKEVAPKDINEIVKKQKKYINKKMKEM